MVDAACRVQLVLPHFEGQIERAVVRSNPPFRTAISLEPIPVDSPPAARTNAAIPAKPGCGPRLHLPAKSTTIVPPGFTSGHAWHAAVSAASGSRDLYTREKDLDHV